jgi:hypothetical protein
MKFPGLVRGVMAAALLVGFTFNTAGAAILLGNVISGSYEQRPSPINDNRYLHRKGDKPNPYRGHAKRDQMGTRLEQS